ncbi:DNA repair protein RAD51 homolog 3 [Synchiropus splendidus]|uniref:DNA repair protein RAD51 homolog 3 n=1 Tax=Synchiropus splendidus TaxID=270530 RepID=UPI00237EB00A|nr:DNA repair protein RAD51 homolog 3 [Synchiropus splendidus]
MYLTGKKMMFILIYCLILNVSGFSWKSRFGAKTCLSKGFISKIKTGMCHRRAWWEFCGILLRAAVGMERSVSSLPLSLSVRTKLVQAGFRSTSDLLAVKQLQLSREAGLSQEEATDVQQTVRWAEEGREEAAGVSALELLQKEEELRSIVTFCSELDCALGGGIPVGKTTEICGVPGVGKTQLCLQLAVDAQVPECFGGVAGQVVFVDTEGSFVIQRLKDLAAAAVRHCSLLVENSEQEAAMATFTVEHILANVFIVRCHDYVELIAESLLLPEFLSRHPRVRLLVIDSVAFPFRQHFEDLSQRYRLLNGLAQRLLAVAVRHNVAVVLTNQMTTQVQPGQSQLVPALGEVWAHAPTLRVIFQWDGSQRVARIFKSPGHMDAHARYQITSDGFRDVDSSQQPAKRQRTDVDPTAAQQHQHRTE